MTEAIAFQVIRVPEGVTVEEIIQEAETEGWTIVKTDSDARDNTRVHIEKPCDAEYVEANKKPPFNFIGLQNKSTQGEKDEKN